MHANAMAQAAETLFISTLEYGPHWSFCLPPGKNLRAWFFRTQVCPNWAYGGMMNSCLCGLHIFDIQIVFCFFFLCIPVACCCPRGAHAQVAGYVGRNCCRRSIQYEVPKKHKHNIFASQGLEGCRLRDALQREFVMSDGIDGLQSCRFPAH